MGEGILQDLVVVMVVAAAATIVFYRLRQPVVLGYLLAGLLVGPHTIGLVSNGDSIQGLAELGIIFLMFSVGLEFDLRKLRKVGAAATLAAAVQISFMIWTGFQAGRFLGWSLMDSVFLGAVISISSTVIIVKLLTEMGKLKEEHAELAFGILIVEDVAAIVMVAVLSSMGAGGRFDAGVIGAVVGGILLFAFIFIAVGLVIVPRLIDIVSRFRVEEVLVITVVGLAFGAALLALKLGFSVALGAFLMGAIIAESKAVRRVEHKIVPIRDLFTAVFFVAVGMLINPNDLIAYAWPIAVITLLTVSGKVFGVSFGAFLAGYDGRTAVKTGASMGQIGEFSFIIAGLGLTLGVVRPELHSIAVAVCAVTSLATPALMRWGDRAADRVAPTLPGWYTRALMAYTRAARRLRARNPDALGQPDARRARHGTRIAIYAAWLFGLLISAAYVSDWLGAEVGDALSLGDNATRAAALGFLGLAGLPLFVAFTKATEAYALSAAKARAMNPRQLSRHDARHRRPTFVARVAASLASVLLLGAAVRVAWGVHPLAVPSTWLMVPILMLIAFIGMFAWHHLERLYHGMEATLNELMGTEAETPSSDGNERLRERLPWGMDLEEVHVHSYGRAAYASLKSLNLRDVAGATVLSIERGAGVLPNPHPDLVLLPRDRVILVGKHEQLARAREYLNAPHEHSAPIRGVDLRIPGSSPAANRTLGSLELEETGARVGLVRRKDGTLMAPSPRVSLEPDDRIFVYGSEASIERTRERLRLQRWPESSQPRRGPAR